LEAGGVEPPPLNGHLGVGEPRVKPVFFRSVFLLYEWGDRFTVNKKINP
jgi:hypothetical protein